MHLVCSYYANLSPYTVSIMSKKLIRITCFSKQLPREEIRMKDDRCMHRASSYNMYINQQDAQNSCDQALFSIRCSTCFGLRQSIIRSNFISCTFSICRYHTSSCCVVIATLQPDVSEYTKCDVQLIKVAPADGLIQSETCRASNEKIKFYHKNLCILLLYIHIEE